MSQQVGIVNKYLIKKHASDPSILVGCKVGKLQWPVCGYDVIVFTNNVTGQIPVQIDDIILNIYYRTHQELEDRTNYEINIALLKAKILNDPNLFLASLKEGLLKKEKEVFSQAFEDQTLKLLKHLTYAEEAYGLQALYSTAFWLLVLGYDAVVALNILNKELSSPSHLIQQIRENPLFKGSEFFVSIAHFLGLEYATTTSFKRVFSTLTLFMRMTDFYEFENRPPTDFSKKPILLSDIKVNELLKKCQFAIEQKMPLNAHIISTKWYTDSVRELYHTVCSMEKVSQFNPKIIEELDLRKNKVTENKLSFSSSILNEINLEAQGKSLEEARRFAYKLKKIRG
ncbi:MAG: hypothetical protein QXJ17_01360 [Nitrososphaeria archaeon]